MKHSATSVDHVSRTTRARRSKVRTCELVFRESYSKVLRRGHMQVLVSENGSCQGFPQQKLALSTRFPQILWIKLGKSGKVPKIRVKSESEMGGGSREPEVACEQARTTRGRCFATETENRRRVTDSQYGLWCTETAVQRWPAHSWRQRSGVWTRLLGSRLTRIPCRQVRCLRQPLHNHGVAALFMP